MTLADRKPHPHHHARVTPDKPAYIMAATGEVVTYEKLEETSNQGAHLFRKLGLKRGDNVVLLAENSIRLPQICFAAARSGLFYTAMSTRLSRSEAEYIVNDCGAKIMIASASLAQVARQAFDAAEGCTHLFFIDGDPDAADAWERATEALPTTPIADQSAGIDMLYSSGTTGRPKGVKVSFDVEAFDDPVRIVGFLKSVYHMTDDVTYLCPAPLYHAAPLRFTLGVMRLGGTAIIMDKFDAEKALDCIQRYGVTHSQWVPSMFVRLLKLPERTRLAFDVSSLKQAIHAAAPCPVPVKRAMIDWWGPVIEEYYAGSEGSGFVACNSEEWLANPGTVGRARDCELKILDEDGNELPPGEDNIGDVYFAGGPLFEYHNAPDKTAGSRSRQGWTTLGDIGYLNENGFLFLTDRKANMIISGGVNIYPQEVENLLITHPKVADVAVFGVPNEDFGEEVKAVVQPIDWADATDAFGQDLIGFCQNNISRLKCPRSVDFMAELPRHPTGKLYKRLLRDQYWADQKNKLV